MVADVVELMASHGPYRPGLGSEAALNEIEKNRDIFHDSEVVNTWKRKGFPEKRGQTDSEDIRSRSPGLP